MANKKVKGLNTKKSRKVIKEPKRTVYTLEQKDFAIKLRKEGKKPKEILKLFKDKYDITPKASSLATFYKPENMKRFEKIGQKDTRMASIETVINKSQRPTLMVDMEFSLREMVKKSSTPITKSGMQRMAKALFKRLRALQIYDDSGERLQSLSELSEDHINDLLATEQTICPLCNDAILPGLDAVRDHLAYFHAVDAAQTGRDEPEKEVFKFTASDGWVKNFIKRHNLHKVAIVGEMGSSDKEADDELDIACICTQLNSLRISKHHEEATQELFMQLKIQEPSDNGPKEIESSETHQSFDKQSDDELDIECIRTQLNGLPCRPGGKCCCNTDFSPQVPEYILDLLNIMPENTIIIVDNDKILYL